jgi:HEXXH motif-containing protein
VIFQHHGVPESLFKEIASGAGGAEAVEDLAAAQHSKRKFLLWQVLMQARESDPDQWRLASQGYDLLADAQQFDPAAADMVIMHSSVGAWAARTLRALLRPDDALPGAEPGVMCTVAAAAAIRARLPAQIEVPVRQGTVMLPSLGAAALDGDRAIVRSTVASARVDSATRQVEIPPDMHRDAPGWKGLRRVTVGPFDAIVDDLDPFRMPAVPDLAGRLSAADAAAWAAAFREAWPLLDRHDSGIAAEIAAAIKAIVPRNVQANGLVSSSSPETFGAVAMSRPPDACALAESLAHEVQHVKLSALQDVVMLTEPDDGRRFYAPWRDDPRPIAGLLQGAYAFLGVAGFWRCQRHHEDGAAGIRAHAAYARWRAATAFAISTLGSSGRLTEPGEEFVRGMARTLNTWMAEPVPEQAHALARLQNEHHLDRWRSAHGPVLA